MGRFTWKRLHKQERNKDWDCSEKLVISCRQKLASHNVMQLQQDAVDHKGNCQEPEKVPLIERRSADETKKCGDNHDYCCCHR